MTTTPQTDLFGQVRDVPTAWQCPCGRYNDEPGTRCVRCGKERK